ncbi:MAG: tetratricopeptide repeat protein [Cytophagales bacterium]|nr:tetratricopeptide repeat protein [Armatimonadota bacterium]
MSSKRITQQVSQEYAVMAGAGSDGGNPASSPPASLSAVGLVLGAPPVPAENAVPVKQRKTENRETRSLRRAADLAAEGKIDRALDHLRRLIVAVPNSLRGRLRLATLLREKNKSREALEVLRAAVQNAPLSLQPREMLAELCLEAGRWEEAVEQCRALLALSPNSILARDILSAVHLQRGHLEKALRVIDEMIRLDPRDAGNHFKRGVLLQQMGNVGGAVTAFERALEMAPDTEAAEESRAALEMLDNYQIRQVITLAVEDLGFRVQLRRDSTRAITAKGYILSHSGLSALSQMRFDDLPDAPPGWRHLFYH